jgi:hypothetical protein
MSPEISFASLINCSVSLDKLLGQLAAVGISQLQIQVSDPTEDHRSQEAERRGRRNQNVPAMR